MESKLRYIQVEDEMLHYIKLGKGKKLLIAFHGYANDAWLFAPFEPYFGNEYTLVAIDLPHHGKSKWPENKPLLKKDLVTIVNNLRKEFEADTVSLLGYSLGGRVCLAIIEQIPELIDRVLLIAPDGLVFNPLYYFVTRTFIGKLIFRGIVNAPSRYMRLFNWLKEKDWLDASRHKFVSHYLETNESRSFLMKVWPDMSNITTNIKKLKAIIKQYQMPVYIYMGTYDKIIPPKLAEKFAKDLTSVKLFILEKGHRVFDTETLPQMAECLLT